VLQPETLSSSRRFSRPVPVLMRMTASFLVVVLLLTSIPIGSFAIEPHLSASEALLVSDGVLTASLGDGAPNRTVPVVSPPALTPRFSDPPTDQEMFQARVFEEPLVPTATSDSIPSHVEENRSLAAALRNYAARRGNEEISFIQRFVDAHPQSRWTPSLLLNLGFVYNRTGYWSNALDCFEKAWKATENISEPGIKILSNRALAELVSLNARFGRMEQLEPLIAEIDGRKFSGPATEKVAGARELASLMKSQPSHTMRCGPYALARMLAAQGKLTDEKFKLIHQYQTSPQGVSLDQIRTLASQLGVTLQMAKRTPGSRVLVPAIVHWKLGHYGVIQKEENGFYQLEDPGAQERFWISSAALDAEGSGYFLTDSRQLPAGWNSVDVAEGQNIWGRGSTTNKNDDDNKCDDQKNGGKAGGGGGCCGGSGGSGIMGYRGSFTSAYGSTSPYGGESEGMATYDFHTMLVSLHLTDSPVGYTPPLGPSVRFNVNYSQREANQPSTFTFSNLGPKWTFNWISWVVDDPLNAVADVKIFTQSGGAHTFTGFNTNSQSFAPQFQTHGTLFRTSTNSYELRASDGSKQIFSQPDGGVSFPRRVMLTREIDLQGKSISYTYDSQLRVVSVQDAIGQVTTLSYDHPTDNLKITKVTDPFGRYATFDYDGDGRLIKITDVVGLTSEFTYDGSSDFINSLITGYGTTTFEYGEDGATRWLEATDPLGEKERLEFRENAPGVPVSVSAPSGFSNGNMEYRNSFYWDKKALKEAAGDYTKAINYHWLHDTIALSTVSGILESEKKPLENRIFYLYPGQSSSIYLGTNGSPSQVGRLLDDGSSQLFQYEYNDLGQRTKMIDPVGRTTLFNYSTNLIDLTEVRQVVVATNELLASYAYNAQHLPLTVVDAAGQTNTFTYTTNSQLQTITNPKGEVTTLNYNASGYLTNVVGAVAGAVTSFGYDGKGRVHTTTDSEGYVLTTDYDDLDRVTQVTYPDGTTEQNTYSKLDVVKHKDRLNRLTQQIYNARRQMTASMDAAGRMTQFGWCSCGQLENITDPAGNVTTWFRDIQGRVTDKLYADGTALHYLYESATSRLKSAQDAKNQFAQYRYEVDNDLLQVSYSNAVVSTPSVSFTYDTNYNRVVTMVDGIGTNAYSYYSVNGSPGSGRLQSIDGPWSNDTVTYAYDKLGRVTSRIINNSTNTMAYDTLGRVTGVTNALGGFVYAYTNQTTRLASISYPNGQATTFDYFSNTGDQRLKTILNKNSGGSTVSKFDYEYDADGEISKWTQQADSATAQAYELKYDNVNQLLDATLKNTLTSAIVKQYAYGYDKAGNRTSEQVDLSVTKSIHNKVNQITSQSGTSGPLSVEGDLSEPATVSVNGTSATVSSNNTFRATINATTGSNTLSVIAIDYSGNTNTSTNRYSVVVSAGSTNLIYYDLNGNCTNQVSGSVSTQYAWDARNQLVNISTNGVQISAFSYDGMGRRVKIVDGPTTNAFVWCGTEICEQRDATGGTVNKRYFGQGFQLTSTNYFYTRDHLGSIREVIGSSGTNVVARYDYDPYGRRTLVSGSDIADFGFTGHFVHKPSGLHLAMYRAYDANLGRWLSRDPIEERGGLNLYGYVSNSPINFIDPDGNSIGFAIYAIGIGALIYKAAQFGIGISSLNNAADAIQAYRDAVKRMHDRYGDCLPDSISDALDQWKKDLVQQFGSSVAPFLQNTPGTTMTGPAANPGPVNQPPVGPTMPFPSPQIPAPPWYGRPAHP